MPDYQHDDDWCFTCDCEAGDGVCYECESVRIDGPWLDDDEAEFSP